MLENLETFVEGAEILAAVVMASMAVIISAYRSKRAEQEKRGKGWLRKLLGRK